MIRKCDLSITLNKIILISLLLVYFGTSAQIQIGDDIDGEAEGDRSGYFVSLSADGTVLAVGAPENDGNGTNSGHVRVYQFSGSSWIQIGEDIDGEAEGDQSGWSLSLNADGTILAIGSLYNDANGTDSGQVRVYQFSGNSWSQIGIDINGEASGDLFGFSVSLSADGNILAVGAPQNDGNGPDSGQVRVYQFLGSNWTQMGSEINGETASDFSGGTSISSDGLTLAVRANSNDGNGIDSGHVRVYRFIANNWIQVGQDIDGEAAEDDFGWSSSLNEDGNIIAIGARRNDGNGDNAGHVRVYQLINNNWLQIGGDIEGEAANDQSGRAVSLNADGTILAVGGPVNGNGTNAGHVRIFKFFGGNWTQIGSDIDGEEKNDFSGWSVSLNSDGSILTVGAPPNDGNGNDSGHVRVYNLEGILGTEDFILKSLALYPNPANKYLVLSNPQSLSLNKATIYDLRGRLIKQVNLSNMGLEKRIDVSILAKNTPYIISIQDDKRNIVKKFIKK